MTKLLQVQYFVLQVILGGVNFVFLKKHPFLIASFLFFFSFFQFVVFSFFFFFLFVQFVCLFFLFLCQFVMSWYKPIIWLTNLLVVTVLVTNSHRFGDYWKNNLTKHSKIQTYHNNEYLYRNIQTCISFQIFNRLQRKCQNIKAFSKGYKTRHWVSGNTHQHNHQYPKTY